MVNLHDLLPRRCDWARTEGCRKSAQGNMAMFEQIGKSLQPNEECFSIEFLYDSRIPSGAKKPFGMRVVFGIRKENVKSEDTQHNVDKFRKVFPGCYLKESHGLLPNQIKNKQHWLAWKFIDISGTALDARWTDGTIHISSTEYKVIEEKVIRPLSDGAKKFFREK